ncbi:hypothetical protein ACFY71_41015 [Streptomyces cinerochromogenes]|uniref:hypothetical protein n=1 Tax=Streptomyces cinerochromogenes TaxID=66422 RepID=UPI003681DFFD
MATAPTGWQLPALRASGAAPGTTAHPASAARRQGSRLDALRFARRIVQQQTAVQLEVIDRWIADEESETWYMSPACLKIKQTL